ncbi:tetratricopeptide repeat protein [Lacibacter luteus]|uniref:Tetratricopeptide repeat protein n=1 Tax=Lacibacter luteus TaxID=2508719 RepID=A0A4Q1CH04_9BACT|nr:tetratricopeptide repeat protein [Lacibacter luteus]RXK59171.1 tetratricopeptide repeat protein [Lacibacter luteus]
MKRSLSLAFVAVVFVQQLFAQSVDEGKKFMYYERFKSAKDVFEKLVAANPKNEESAYWLGQAFIGLEDVAKAKQTYQTALAANATSPLLMAGMGHVELLENKATDARNHFDMAINNSKSKDNDVLHAVGRANAYTKAGDANYGITHLQKILTTKKFNDPSVYVTIGDAYRKLVDGGNAVLAFKNALLLNPKYAAAKHKEGLIYESQKNKDYYLPAYEEAVTMDPAYGPALYSLYFYWYFRDVAKAEDYLHKYIAAIDSDPQNDYYTIDLKYAAGKYSEAISLADALIAKVGANVIKPRIYRLKAYSYFKSGDLANAKANVDEFFKKAKPEDIVPKDYELLGDIFAGTAGSEAQAYGNYEKAMDADTVQDNKASYLDKAVALARKKKDTVATAVWMKKQFETKKSPNNVDIYNLGRAYMNAGAIEFKYFYTADSIFKLYTDKYPDQYFGYYWRGRANWSIDTSMTNGLANPHFEKFIELALPTLKTKDSVNSVIPIKTAYKYFIGYNIFTKKDYKVAIEFCDKVLAIDPADKEAAEYKRQLTGGKSQTTGSTTTTKPGGATSNSGAASGGGSAPKTK